MSEYISSGRKEGRVKKGERIEGVEGKRRERKGEGKKKVRRSKKGFR